MTVQAAIPAAGWGKRLAHPHPKPMAELNDGRTIMHQQPNNPQSTFDRKLRLAIVVGFKMEQIMERVPDSSVIYNENFDQTNISKGLHKALKNSPKVEFLDAW